MRLTRWNLQQITSYSPLSERLTDLDKRMRQSKRNKRIKTSGKESEEQPSCFKENLLLSSMKTPDLDRRKGDRVNED